MVYPGLVSHANLHTRWQPHTGRPADECAAGQRDVLAHLGNIHVFHSGRPRPSGILCWLARKGGRGSVR